MIALLFAATLTADAASVQTGYEALRATPAAGVSASGYASPPTKADAAGDPNEMVCKRITVVGTHLPSKDCRSRADWNQLTADSKTATHDLRANQNGLNQVSAGSVFNEK